MPFDLSSAQPVAPPAAATGGFDLASAQPVAQADSGLLNKFGHYAVDSTVGAVKGASDIGATLLSPVDAIIDAVKGDKIGSSNDDRRASLAQFFKENANPDSLGFKAGDLGATIAGTAGVGGLAAGAVKAAAPAIAEAAPAIAQYAPKLAAALESGGFSLDAPAATTVAGKIANAATRIGAGSAVGGISAGLVNPEDTGAGAAIGGVLPGATKLAGMAGSALAGDISPEVSNLYQRAKDLGIDIPADRIVNSKPLNALASSLNYVPLSGRAATENTMFSQMNQALSRTFGQDSDNVTMALRKARTDLGQQFDDTLQNNSVKADGQLVVDLKNNMETANRELGEDGKKIIGNQIENILSKVGPDGTIDGQAAYNIKKALDRIAGTNQPYSFYAGQLKNTLMNALDRSLGTQDAAAFKTLRQQYGNMIALQKLAQNGAEGGISIGRLANLKNINNPQLQELADIATQFLKSRESNHGAAQRVFLSGLGTAGGIAAPAAIPGIVAGIGAARGTNALLNSGVVKNLVLNGGKTGQLSLPAANALRALTYAGASRGNP